MTKEPKYVATGVFAIALAVLIAVVMHTMLTPVYAQDATEKPGRPENLTLNADGRRIVISYDPPSGNVAVSGYDVDFRIAGAGGNPWVNIMRGGTETRFSLTVVRPARYLFRVAAVNSAGNSKWAKKRINVRGITTPPKPSPTATATPPPTPTVTPEPTPSPRATTEPTPSPRATTEPTPSPTVTPEPTPSPTVTPEPTPSPTVTPEPTPSPKATPEPTPSPKATPEPTPSPKATPEPTPSPTAKDDGPSSSDAKSTDSKDSTDVGDTSDDESGDIEIPIPMNPRILDLVVGPDSIVLGTDTDITEVGPGSILILFGPSRNQDSGATTNFTVQYRDIADKENEDAWIQHEWIEKSYTHENRRAIGITIDRRNVPIQEIERTTETIMGGVVTIESLSAGSYQVAIGAENENGIIEWSRIVVSVPGS